MAYQSDRGSLTFRDAKMQTSTMRFPIDGSLRSANLAALAAAAATISNATVRYQGQPLARPVAGAAAVYQTVEDKAVFVFTDAAGGVHRFRLPAPKAAVFQADGETIDFSNADVATWVAAVIANAIPIGGGAFVSVGGYRQRTATQRRFNVYTRNPAETGQGL